LKLIDAQLQSLSSYAIPAGKYNDLDTISVERGTGLLSDGNGAFLANKVCASGCDYTVASAAFLLYSNSNYQTWAFDYATTLLRANPLTELKAIGGGKYVVLDNASAIDYTATANLLRQYIVDSAATENDLSMKLFYLELSYTKFVLIFTTVNELEVQSNSSITPSPPRTEII
jgi:hypothetical protein